MTLAEAHEELYDFVTGGDTCGPCARCCAKAETALDVLWRQIGRTDVDVNA